MEKRIKIIKTKTYMDSLYKLKDNALIVAVEKKVNKLLENPEIIKGLNSALEDVKTGNYIVLTN